MALVWRRILLGAALLLASGVSAYGQAEVVSRFGKLMVQQDEADGLKHFLLFKDKKILEYEGHSLEIEEVLQGRGRDFVVIVEHSGGIACPAQMVIVELNASGGHTVSDEFGTCLPPAEVRLMGDKLVIEMSPYVPHPELISKRELLATERSKVVFTWYQGKLAERWLPRTRKSK